MAVKKFGVAIAVKFICSVLQVEDWRNYSELFSVKVIPEGEKFSH